MFQKPSPQGAAFLFRRFGRKGYSLFAALGKEVKIGVLTVATLSTAAPCLGADRAVAVRLQADDAEEAVTLDDDVQLSEAVTTASRTPMAAAVAARRVMTLGRAELAAAGVTCVNDVLKLCAGIDVRQRGSFGMQTDISINGGTFDQITILVNGIPINNPQTGHNAADFPLNLSDIERIEILEGAASRVLGTQAFSGAVNVVTHSADEGFLLRAAGGSYGTAEAEGRGAWRQTWGERKLSASVSSSYRRSDGAVDNGDFTGGKLFATTRYDDPAFRLDAQFGLSSNSFGANTFYSAAYPNQWEATDRALFSLKGETKGRIRLSPQLSWLRNVDHFQLIRNTHKAENFHRGDVFTLGLNAWTEWALGRTAVGAEMREEGIYSTNLGTPLAPSLWMTIPGKIPTPQPDGSVSDIGGGAAYYTKHAARTNLSYFLEHTLVFDRWTLSLGTLAQRNTAADHKFRFYPGLDIAYRPAPSWRLYASWNRALRLPTFTDLFYKSPTQEGNVGLRPEENSSFRFGSRWRPAAGVSVDVSAFYHRGSNMIDWVMYAANDKFHSTNFRLDNYGAGTTVEFNGDLLLGTRQPLRRLRLDYAWMNQNRKDTQVIFKSNYALEYLRHKFTAVLDHRLFSHLGASWTLRLQERNGNYQEIDRATRKPTGRLSAYGTHARLDARLHWTTARHTFFADFHNLTAHRFYDIANVEQPGFFIMAGASWKF